MLEFKTVKVDPPKDCNVILGMAHFIKTAEDIYEALVNSLPNIKFGIGFCESSGPCLVRHEGNDEELKKAADADPVYKHAGSVLIKSTKANLIAELEEKKELANTRVTVLAKQETRVKESIKEQETKINEMIRGTQKPSPQQNINNQNRS